MRPRPALLLTALLASGCGAATFACDGDASCGEGGRCEANGYCSFVDDGCASGRRFGEHAPASIAGACVEQDAGTEGPGSTTTSSGDGVGSSSAAGSSGDAETSTITATAEATSSSADATTASGSDGDTGDPTPIEVGPIPIADDLDDGSMWPAAPGEPGAWLPSGETRVGLSYLGEYPAGQPYWGYFRFQLPRALPVGTVVQAAVLTIDGHATYQWDEQVAALRVWAERSLDAPPVGGLASLPGSGLVTLTDASVRWPAVGGLAWSTDGSNASSDLAPALQEVVDQGGLANGAFVQLWVAADDIGSAGQEVGWIDRSAADDRQASLSLTLLLPSP